MARFNKIAIIGVGLIGGSIGLAVKKKKLAKQVVGICRRKISARSALRKKAVDKVTLDYKEGLKGADLVIIATPVGRVIDIAEKVIKNSEGNLILTDVGSTKEMIVKEIEKIVPSRIRFIGSHPMAGSEKNGVSSADEDLFKNSVCVVTKTGKTDNEALNKVKRFWSDIGATCRVLSPAKHDYYISFISHVPHIVAMALASSVHPDSLRYASTGFKDTTRVASSDPILWHDIFVSNAKSIKVALSRYKKILNEIEKNISGNKREALINILTRSKIIRDKLE